MNRGTETKCCLVCNKPVKGRTDKKYCDDYCRNNYNNQLHALKPGPMRIINQALGKNRRILQSLLPEGEKMRKTTKDQLLHRGFHFKYFTHTYINKKGNQYFFCYDHGYLPLEKEVILLVKQQSSDY
ncbi:MAG: hypothetical protein JWQ27_1657 [Ferruginibacter sp.]|nr:hypothetical protein [Ferruginibacter sp.]